MKTECYPDEKSVKRAIADNDPLLALISHDGQSFFVSNIDVPVNIPQRYRRHFDRPKN